MIDHYSQKFNFLHLFIKKQIFLQKNIQIDADKFPSTTDELTHKVI